MLTVRSLPGAGVTAVVVLLAGLWASVGLTAAGWCVGVLAGVVISSGAAMGLHRAGSHGPGPADLVTLTRAILTCAVAALTADALLHQVLTPIMVPITVVALALDAVDGWVARRTMTCSAFGGQFDGEVDAFLILVLSVYLTPGLGGWILSAGLVRYAFAMAGWALPWMRARLPYRYWRKVVTATLGIVLTLAASGAGPRWFTTSGLLLGVVLLAESFGRDVLWLWSHRVVPARARRAVGASSVVRPQPRIERV